MVGSHSALLALGQQFGAEHDAVAEAVEQQSADIGGGVELGLLGRERRVLAVDNHRVRSRLIDQLEKRPPQLRHGVGVIGVEDDDGRSCRRAVGRASAA